MLCTVSKKEYRSGEIMTVDIQNWHDYGQWFCDLVLKGEMLSINLVMGDNRENLKEAFGEPNWRWRHDGQIMHTWVLHHDNHTFLVMTGVNKGTCIEVIVPPTEDFNEAMAHVSSKEILNFANWLKDELMAIKRYS